MSNAFVPMRCAQHATSLMARFVNENGRWDLVEAQVLAAGGGPPPGGAVNVSGAFGLGAHYAGCPQCGNGSFVRCGRCGTLSCWSGAPQVVCVACGDRNTVSGSISQVNASDLG